IRDVIDGTSNTLFVGEQTPNNPDGGTGGSQRAPFWGYSYAGFIQSGIVPSSLSFVAGYDTCRAIPGNTKPVCQSVWYSNHGEVNFRRADGSVRGISRKTDVVNTWVALGTIAGKEVIGEF